jgi:hypothetical protein
MNNVGIFGFALAMVLSAQGKEWLSLTNLNGVVIEAQVLQIKGERVQLKGRNGSTYVVPLSVLGAKSRSLVLQAIPLFLPLSVEKSPLVAN